MSEPHDHLDDDDITFTIGTGNQSAICGGVAPMEIIDPQSEANPEKTKAAELTDAPSQDPVIPGS